MNDECEVFEWSVSSRLLFGWFQRVTSNYCSRSGMGQATPIGRSPNRKFLSKREWWSTIRPETPAHRCPSTLKGDRSCCQEFSKVAWAHPS